MTLRTPLVLLAPLLASVPLQAATAYTYAYPRYTVEMAAGTSNALRHVSALTKVSAEGAAAETVSYADFQATATEGSLLKTGTGTLTIDEAIAGFDGQVHVMEGVLIACCSNALGKTSHLQTPKESERAYVHAGATLVMDDPQSSLVRQEANSIYFEGDGAPGLGGSLVARNGNRAGGDTFWPFGVKSRPTGPCRIYIDVPAWARVGVTYSAGGARGSSFDMAANDGFICGRDPYSNFIINAAQITSIAHLSISNVLVTLGGNSGALEPKSKIDTEVRFLKGSRLRLERTGNLQLHDQRQTSRFVIDGMEELMLKNGRYHPLATGVDPFVSQDGYTNCIWWCGPVVLNTDLRLQNEFSPVRATDVKRTQGFTLTNTVSGVGVIRPSYKNGVSWGQGITVNLMAPNNCFTGGIVLDQSTLAVWRNGAVPAQDDAGRVSITNGCVRFCKMPTAAEWDTFAMPETEFVGAGAVTNGTGRWRALVKKGAGTLDYHSQMGGSLLDVQEGTVAMTADGRLAFDIVRCAGGSTLDGDVTVAQRLTLAQADVEQSGLATVTGELKFEEGSVVAIDGARALSKNQKSYVLVTAGRIVGNPVLALTASTQGWQLVKTETSLVLRQKSPSGFWIVLRGGPVTPPESITYRTVTFRRLNGTVLDRVAVAEGSSVAVPAGPEETNMRFVGWDRAEKLVNVTSDVDVWALYEAMENLSPSTAIVSKGLAAREAPYSLEEYFQLYDHLAWSDEFSGTELNRGTKSTSFWGTTYSGGNWNYDMEQRNGELHKHTESCAIVSDGCLRLRTRRQTNGNYQFESGGIKSNGKVAFKYGRCEIRAKLCRGLGVWPAFWFMGSTDNWPKCGEIDAMEQMNGGAWMASTLHIPNAAQNGTIQTQATCGPTDGVHWGDGFHRIGVIINEREIVFYTDDMIHERIDITDSRYDLIRNRSQYMIIGSGMGGAWSGVTSADQVPAAFQSEDYVVDYCRIYTNETEGRTLERADTSARRLSGPVSATAWKGWSMSWGKSGAGAYQSDISTNGFTEAFYVDCAVNQHVARDKPDVVVFLTDPACMTGADSSGHFWTNLQLNVEGMLVARPKRLADAQHEALGMTVMYDARRFSATDSVCATLPFADTGFTNATAVCAELVERSTGAKVTVFGVDVAVASTVDELKPVTDWLTAHRTENVIFFFQGLSYAAYKTIKELTIDSAYNLIGEESTGYRRVYTTGAGSAAKPANLTIVNPSRPAKVSSHTMQALQATAQW